MSYNPYSLENKTILVTGASSGIGKATAIECAKLGASVVVTASNERASPLSWRSWTPPLARSIRW